jgi:hypothetical protein
VSRRRFHFARSTLLVAWILALGAFSDALADPEFEDSWIRLELPQGWSIDGEGGEYMLESGAEDIASLLVLAPDPERSIEEVLAEIEEQFLSTGMFALESTEERIVDGEPVHVRRYRMTGGPADDKDASVTIHHQFSFWRDDVHVLLQVETGAKSASPDRLFSKIFSTLRILEAPVPFLYEDYGDEEFEDEFPPDDASLEGFDESELDSVGAADSTENEPELSP